jgi:DNA polymerase
MDKNVLWENLVREIAECRRCEIAFSRKNPVPGEGSLDAEVMFIGEAPGAREDELGRPFVGAAGNLLTKMLEEIGLRREDVFIGNVLKCRPPGNRDPTDEEISNCLPFLIRQIKLIQPRIIVTLGRFSAKVISELAGVRFRGITRERGIAREIVLFDRKIILLPTYHPAAALYKPPLLEYLKKDFQTLKNLLVEKPRRTGTLDDFF